MKFAALLAFFVALAFSLTPEPVYEVFGKVTEPGIGVISNVGVSVLGFTDTVRRGAVSDAQGNFRVRLDKLGPYMLFAEKSGYSSVGDSRVTLDAAHPKGEVNLEMFRMGKICGRVIDDESREPLKGFTVYA